ncbi:MAG TPA: hypothetical protein VIV57_10965, partial [Anaeromyxobacter sp.]
MRRSPRAVGLAPALLALAGACSLSTGGSGAPAREAEVRIWMPPLVHWEPGADRHVDVAIENGSTRTLALAEPDPANARVAVFRGGDDLRLCGVEPRSAATGPRRRIELPPGGSAAIRVELDEACAGVPPGEYRFEVDYRSPPVEDAKAFSGSFATRHGELVVEAGPLPAQAEGSPPTRRGRAPPRSSPQRGRDRSPPAP